ncbi:glycosyltransferase family 2 protein [Ferroplasma sp.]|uniref:glycosyltransferase family A protein n=1 Tax=Ferroplasma sp. TaxID=2591003 RepID=UPI00307DEAF3
MDSNNNYISVIVTDYNRKEYIMEALKSVVNQSLSRENYEIILVKNFRDEHIDTFALENKIKNIYSNDNTLSGKIIEALKIAKGKIISFLDDDDMFFKSKLEYVIKKFDSNAELCYFHNNFSGIDENGKTIAYYNENPDFNMSSISMKSDIINVDGLSKVSKSIDTLMYLYAVESGKDIVLDDEKLTYYRVTGNSVTHSFNDINSFINFSYDSLKKILVSYSNMITIFHSRKVIKILKHKISFTKIRIKLFGISNAGFKDYLNLLATPSLEARLYELKVAFVSIFLKKYAVKKLYENEKKKEIIL